jgi:hypothetical protein
MITLGTDVFATAVVGGVVVVAGRARGGSSLDEQANRATATTAAVTKPEPPRTLVSPA